MLHIRYVTRWLAVVALVLLLLPNGSQGVLARPSVAAPFGDYYTTHQGVRVLGYPLPRSRA